MFEVKNRILKVIGEEANLNLTDNLDFGDYSTNIALKKKNPKDEANKIKDKLLNDEDLMKLVEKIEVAGPGFINFWIKKDGLIEELERIAKEKEEYGKSKTNEGKKVVVEYSSPNIAKPFTVGHLRSTLIGDAIANLLEVIGWKVYRDNHLGDWGTQFGKLIYMIKRFDSSRAENSLLREPSASSRSFSGSLHDLDLKKLVNMYVEFHKEAEKDKSLEDRAREEFKKLEQGDVENRKIWKFCIDISMKEFNHIYSKLGIKFTENEGKGYGESFFEDKMQPVIKELQDKGLLKEGKEGAKMIEFPEEKFPPLMILKKDGATLYSTRDLATDKFRLERYGRDVVIVNEVGAEQTLYFQQLFEVEKMLNWVKEGQRVHVRHGHFRFKDKKMSTRKGNVIWLDSVIRTAEEKANRIRLGKASEPAKIDSQVGIGALKWNELKRDPIGDIIFDWDEILNMEGNSGAYMQYTYARTQSVLEKAKKAKRKTEKNKFENLDLNSEESDLMRYLCRFGEISAIAAKSYSPNIVCNYLYNLAQKYNTFYNKHKMIGSEQEDFRLSLNMAVGQIIKNGLFVLGIDAPNKM
ncbi:MAG: arginine--tRNA ligase [Candidatus Woesebacteria bacterium]|nr:MAG: arginine--tRNA ligase [Candidatus Woesebacteria bacterium]